MLPDFFFCSLFPVQQTTSGIGHRVKYFFRVGNQYAECEKQQQQQQQQQQQLDMEGLKLQRALGTDDVREADVKYL